MTKKSLVNQAIEKENKILKTRLRHLANELEVTRQEYSSAADNYFQIYSKIEQTVEERTEALQREINERKQTEQALKYRDHLLEATSKIGVELLSVKDLKSAVTKSLKLLGSAAAVDYVFVFEHADRPKKKSLFNCRFFWQKSKGKKIDWKQIEVQRWYKTLVGGVNICGLTREMPEKEQNMLEAYQILSLLAIPIFLEGEFWGFIGVSDCKSERVWLDSEISILKTVSAAIGNAIMSDHANTNLAQAKIAAEEAADAAKSANNAKSEFLSNMSHEIRTPINGIIGMVEILQGTLLSDEQRKFVSDLYYSSETLLSIINDILDFSKIEAGHLELNKQTFDLKLMTKKVFEVMRYQAQGRGLAITYAYDDNLPAIIVGDELRIRQVLVNLLGNAIKFTEKGVVDLTISCKRKYKKKINIAFEVRDTGIGIPTDKIEKLFDKFVQVDPSTTRRYGGTGLGLSICKSLVAEMGGKVAVKSQIGQGSVFSFNIMAGMAEIAPEVETTEVNIEWRKIPKVLMVEDSQSNQTVAKHFFQILGIDVEIAEDGLEAVRMVEQRAYDIIFMDIQMPNLDGFEATKIIRRMEGAGPHIPIVAMTADVLQSTKARFKEVGMDDYLFKPFRKSELEIRLARCLPGFIHGNEEEEKQQEQVVKQTGQNVIESHDKSSVPNDTINLEELSIWNKEIALTRLEGDFELLESTAGVVMREWPELLHILKASLDVEDCSEGKRVAHTLKSSAKYIGGERLAEVAEKMEVYFAESNAWEAQGLYHILVEEVQHLSFRLEEAFPELS